MEKRASTTRRSAEQNSQSNSSAFFQPKLSISHPGDVYEQEADAVAERVMCMPQQEGKPFFSPAVTAVQRHVVQNEKARQRKLAPALQKQEAADAEQPDLSLHASADLQPSAAGPDFLSLRQPFFNRGISHLWDPDSALHVWQYNFDFFRRVGLAPDLSVSLTNLTAPMFIDSQLKAKNPTWWEITDRELNTSTRALSIPVLQFNADFSPTAPSWVKSLFGGSGVQRKEEATSKEKTETGDPFSVAPGSGEPLRQEDRAFYEPRIGYDFSSVRIHTGSAADASAKSINALAYTHGEHIVFAEGQYNPASAEGKKLMAHELAHMVQQKTDTLMRVPNPRPATATDLSSYSEANRRSLVFDTDNESLNLALHFQQGVVETPRAGFDIDYVFAGSIDAWLQPPLRSMARAIFALQENDRDPVRLNTTLVQHLDLSRFHAGGRSSGAAGPDTRFRFTCKEFDSSDSGAGRSRQTTRNVQIMIENIGMAPAIPNATETPAQRIARFQSGYNFYRSDPLLFSDADFNRVLMAVSLVPDSILRSISGIPFNRVIGQARGPANEAAEYSWAVQNGNYTRVINIYDDALQSSTSAESLAFLMTHEIGHALAHRPAEASGTAAQTDLSAETGRGSFREAATTNGGLRNAITVYGRTGWGEYFAEAFSMYINHPDTLRLLRPSVYAYFLARFPAQAQQPTIRQPAPAAP